jgi:tRNA (guanosine-2'-O-)-methyltransferase
MNKPVEVDYTNIPDEELVKFLETFITENKSLVFDKALQERTRFLTVALEDIYQSQNASAVLRTCDCFGIQDIHVIENQNKYTLNPDVAMGAPKWLSLTKYNRQPDNTVFCIETLKNKGYRIVATTPLPGGYTPESLPLDKPVALLFGTEITGLTPQAIQQADDTLSIPMYGFTESFNISVSAAICLHVLSHRIRTENIPWQLSDAEKLCVRYTWIRNVLAKPDLVEQDYRKRIASE